METEIALTLIIRYTCKFFESSLQFTSSDFSETILDQTGHTVGLLIRAADMIWRIALYKQEEER